jgi:hypothetical protein
MKFNLSLSALALATLLAACGGGDDPEETRVQDTRTYTPVAATNTTAYPDYEAAAGGASFTALSGAAQTTSRWTGVLNGASYRIEVPATWNGKLVMYAHGYRGTGADLTVSNPSIRRYLIANNYAWAASSYSKNYYDVRAGVEDTNALALSFNAIAAANGRTLAAPTRYYITGHSMGGHITAAAIEDEALLTARYRVRYHGAVPMCGVVADTALFDTFTAMQVSAQAIAGQAASPISAWSTIAASVTTTLFGATFPTAPITPTTPLGARYASVVENLTGGDRPLFDLALAYGGAFPSAYGTFGGDGTVNGILNRPGQDTNGITYTVTGDTAATTTLNATALKVTAQPDANRLRRDGLRWIPKANGDIHIPVVSIHTLGDLFVPFNMEQVYQGRVAAKGNSTWLKQRAIRGISHCDFTTAEQVTAFDDMIKWERDGVVPTGDDVVTPATVAAPTYGCTFTNNTIGVDDSGTTIALRGLISSTTPACPP